MPDFDPVVLIHGAWQGAWVWDDFVPLLAQRGFTAHAIDLPGNGCDATPPEQVTLALYLDHLGALLDRIGRPVSLVGHSGGGVIASALADQRREQVARLAYIAGMMLPDGMSYAELVRQMRPAHPEVVGIAPYLIWSADRLTSQVEPQAAAALFLSDCPPDKALAAAHRLTPQPEGGRAIAARLTPERFGTVPRLYVEATGDKSVLPIMQRRMQALVPGAQSVALHTGHAPHFSAPQLLADVLCPFLAGPLGMTP